ncbi:putative ankyrin repeat protein, partial [Dictyocoela roeselum]
YQSNPSTYKAKTANAFSVHLLKLAIIDNRPMVPVVCNSKHVFHRQNYIFLRALLNNDTNLVKFFLDNKFPENINSRIFGDENMNAPTYLMLAVSLNNPEILSLFIKAANLKTSWLGITPVILAACNKTYGMLHSGETHMSYITTSQLLALNGRVAHYADLPVFPIDFLCMRGDIANINILIERAPRCVQMSKLCFLVQSNTDIILKLLVAGANPEQKINGITPLHVAAYSNNLAAMVVFHRLGCTASQKDDKGRTPIEYTSEIACFRYLQAQLTELKKNPKGEGYVKVFN